MNSNDSNVVAESTPIENAKKDSIRIQAKGWFLTYPQCSLTKEHLLQELKKTGTITEYIVASEKHESGEPHLHAFIKYSKKVSLTPTKWDVEGHHGNY